MGTWHGVSIGNGEMVFQLADVGMFAVFTIHEDGLMERNSNGEKDEVRCVMIAGVLTVEDEGDRPLRWRTGCLLCAIRTLKCDWKRNKRAPLPSSNSARSRRLCQPP